MSSNDRFVEVLKRLDKLTQDGKQAWRETPDDATFLTEFSNGSSLLLSKYTRFLDEEHGETVINAKLLNQSGQIVEEFEDIDAGWFSVLYSEARAKARKSEDVLDEIWNEITH